MSGIYDRQKEIPLTIPESVMVVGCGGIGFWAGLFLGMTGVRRLYLVDPDVIQIHNLNRLPLPLESVGKSKVEVLRNLILQLRPEAVVLVFSQKINPFLISNIKPEVIVDTTDDYRAQREIYDISSKLGIRYVRGGYDGTRLSVSSKLPTWDIDPLVDTRYTFIPSWLIPATICAALVVAKVVLTPGAEVSLDLRRLEDGKALVL